MVFDWIINSYQPFKRAYASVFYSIYFQFFTIL